MARWLIAERAGRVWFFLMLWEILGARSQMTDERAEDLFRGSVITYFM